jgi:colicin import membrane protein
MVVRTSHLLVAALLHVVVLGLLFVGFRCSRKVEPPVVIQGTIVDSKAQPAQPPPPKEDPRKAEEEARKQKEEQDRKKEEEQKTKQEEAERKQAEAEAQRKAEQQAKLRAQQEAKLKAQEEAKQKAAETAKKKKEETERKAKEEQAKREVQEQQQQKEREDQFQQQIAAEENARQQSAKISKQQLWVAQIAEKVKRNWLRPMGTDEDFQCGVNIRLLPGGQVVGVNLVKSCGSAVLDESVQRAVLKSDPLPTPDDPSVFDPDLNFTFTP